MSDDVPKPYQLHNGDCLVVLKSLPDNSIDSMVTDPPSGIGFIGLEWDKDHGGKDKWISWLQEILEECFRTLKPGAHVLIWAIPRTSHWTATAIENAGFEVRDIITHIFAQGFPKSKSMAPIGQPDLGTALKPSSEHWILARKPVTEDTVTENVRIHGTGAINIEASKIMSGQRRMCGNTRRSGQSGFELGKRTETNTTEGRFPSNTVFSHDEDCLDGECTSTCPIDTLDGQGTVSKPRKFKNNDSKADAGPVSRFFFCSKPNKTERNEGLKQPDGEGVGGYARPSDWEHHDWKSTNANFHPTVKPVKLMVYLVRMITPVGGKCLDPFMGSGTTGVAAISEGFDFVGIEKELDYFEISKARIKHSHKLP